MARTSSAMSKTSRQKAVDTQPLKSNPEGILAKAFRFQSDGLVEWEKDEACEFLHWLKQGLSVLLGLLMGLLPVEGMAGLVVYGVVLCGVTYVWSTNVCIHDNLMDLGELMQEGTMPGIMSFLFFWTIVYTLVYF